MLRINIAPPRLRVADEVDLGKLLQCPVKPMKIQVIRLVLKMHEHRDPEFLRHLSHGPDKLGIALHIKLLLRDDHGAGLEKFLQFLLHVWQIRHFVGAK